MAWIFYIDVVFVCVQCCIYYLCVAIVTCVACVHTLWVVQCLRFLSSVLGNDIVHPSGLVDPFRHPGIQQLLAFDRYNICIYIMLYLLYLYCCCDLFCCVHAVSQGYLCAGHSCWRGELPTTVGFSRTPLPELARVASGSAANFFFWYSTGFRLNGFLGTVEWHTCSVGAFCLGFSL